ncbi:hypothetical protein HanRHA438_Chr14g0669781 [Helianthus annuus]|nr:hypothetical protein HanIR_Chr14g0714901 [Helianthus annuus]KAJ0855107.1 hypothetical protein HanRHA438_Chr14g0669781 [Helianthus annuus]
MIVSILGFIVKIKNPNFICSCVLVDPMVDYWITDLYARGTQVQFLIFINPIIIFIIQVE